MNVVIDYIGGNCPVQARGTIEGKPFYFRSRGDCWSLGIGGDPVACPEWEHEEDYGVWPDAGWITRDQAKAFIDKAAGLYTARNEGKL